MLFPVFLLVTLREIENLMSISLIRFLKIYTHTHTHTHMHISM